MVAQRLALNADTGRWNQRFTEIFKYFSVPLGDQSKYQSEIIMKGIQSMNKHTIIFSILLLSAALLSACSSSGAESAAEVVSDALAEVETQVDEIQSGAQAEASETGNEFSMPSAMQLALGTFKLEETDYAFEADQAQEMLVLWKAVRSLTESETTAAEEIEAVVNQIGESMTAEQMAAIEVMDLSFQDMAAIADQLGFEFGGAGRFVEMTPEMQATMEAMRESGEIPQGGGPGGDFPGDGPGGGPGGGFGGEGGQLSPEARQTAIAERGGFDRAGARLGLNPVLLDAIIDFLQAKVE